MKKLMLKILSTFALCGLLVASSWAQQGSVPTDLVFVGNFSDRDTLQPGKRYHAPPGSNNFCLGAPNTKTVGVGIETGDLISVYYLTPRAENTCFKIVEPSGQATERLPTITRGSADVKAIGLLLRTRNGEIIWTYGSPGSVNATIDPKCNSLHLIALEGETDIPPQYAAPLPTTNCPSQAMTPEQSSYMLKDGQLACDPSAVTIGGTYENLTVLHKLLLTDGQQYFVVAGHNSYGWFQNNGDGWDLLGDPFQPYITAAGDGPFTMPLIENLDISGLIGTELYVGIGTSAEDMMLNGKNSGHVIMEPRRYEKDYS